MANLSAERTYEYVGFQDELSAMVTVSTTYYAGGLLVLKPTTGYAAKPTDTANEELIGIATTVWGDGSRENKKEVGTTSLRVCVYRGKVWFPVSGCAQTDVGVIHYAEDDATMTKTAGNKTVGYRALDYKPGFLLFDFRHADRIA